MLTFFKINSEQQLEWDHDPQDLTTFVVIIKVIPCQSGSYGTYVLSNQKHQKEITKRYFTVGRSTIKLLSQFDVALETSISCLSGKMIVIGQEALKAFLEASGQPFTHAGLKQVLETAIENRASNQEEEDSLGCTSPLN